MFLFFRVVRIRARTKALLAAQKLTESLNVEKAVIEDYSFKNKFNIVIDDLKNFLGF